MGLEPRTVQVDGDGRPVQEPPPGSYAAMARAQAQAQRQAQAAQPPEVPPQQPEPAVAPPQEPPAAPPPEVQTPPAAEPQFTPNVQQRFSELTQARRAAEQLAQQREAELAAERARAAQLQQQLEAAQAERQRELQTQLDQLDPETRAQVMADARMMELEQSLERRLLERVAPTLQELQRSTEAQHLAALASRYPAFNVEVHKPLIDLFRQHNPKATMEQAWKAVAEPEELQFGPPPAPASPPPTVTRAQAQTGTPRNVPPPPPEDPEKQMREDARRIRELMASGNPDDRLAGQRLVEQNLRQRLSARFNG